jgi:hypothetical protein
MLAGQHTSIPPARLAAHAHRDLELLGRDRWPRTRARSNSSARCAISPHTWVPRSGSSDVPRCGWTVRWAPWCWRLPGGA